MSKVRYVEVSGYCGLRLEVPGPMNLNGTSLGMMVANDDFHGIPPVQILIMILPSGKRLQKTMDNYYF
jgi:hypothetical protein